MRLLRTALVPIAVLLLAGPAAAASLSISPVSSPLSSSASLTTARQPIVIPKDPIFLPPALPGDPADESCAFNPNVVPGSTYRVSFRWESYDREWFDGPHASLSGGDWHAHRHDARIPEEPTAPITAYFQGASILYEGEECPAGWEQSTGCFPACKDAVCNIIDDFKSPFCSDTPEPGYPNCPLECMSGGLTVCQRKFVGQHFNVYGDGATLTSGPAADEVQVDNLNGPWLDEYGHHDWRRAQLGTLSYVQEPYVQVTKDVVVDEACNVPADTWYRFKWQNSWKHLDGARRVYHANHAFEWDVCLGAGADGVERIYAPDDHFDVCTTDGCGKGEFHVSAVRFCSFECVGGACAGEPPSEEEPPPPPEPGHCLCDDGTVAFSCLAPDDDDACDHGCRADGHYGGLCQAGL